MVFLSPVSPLPSRLDLKPADSLLLLSQLIHLTGQSKSYFLQCIRSSRTWTQYTPSFQLISAVSSVLPRAPFVLFCFAVFIHLLLLLSILRPPVAKPLHFFFLKFCSKLQRIVRTLSFISATLEIFHLKYPSDTSIECIVFCCVLSTSLKVFFSPVPAFLHQGVCQFFCSFVSLCVCTLLLCAGVYFYRALIGHQNFKPFLSSNTSLLALDEHAVI